MNLRMRRLAAALTALTMFIALMPSTITRAAQGEGALAIDEASLHQMERATAAYADMAAQGGWPRFGLGPTIRLGDSDSRIPALRQLLTKTGDLTMDDSRETEVLTAALEAAVRRYQSRHGLMPDGVIGQLTQTALNVPAAERADTLAETWSACAISRAGSPPGLLS